MNQKIFCERLMELMNDNNITQEILAKELGLSSKGSISKYLHGKVKSISIEMIYNIAYFFNVSPCWLAGWCNDKYYGITK